MATSVNLGELNQRVTIERRQGASNALGEQADGWTPVATVWARVQPLRTRDQFAAGQAGRATDHRVLIRHRADVDGGCRLVWKGHPLEIEGDPVPLDGGSQWLEINAIKGVRDGR